MHADFALGGDLARRYPAKIAPMAGVREISNASLNALAALILVGLFGPEPVSEAGDLLVVTHKHISNDLRPTGQLTAHRAHNRTHARRCTRHVALGRIDKARSLLGRGDRAWLLPWYSLRGQAHCHGEQAE